MKTTLRGWASKARGPKGYEDLGAAHFIDDDGTTACSKQVLTDGRPRLAPFMCEWVPMRADCHHCVICQGIRLNPRS